MKRTDSLPIRLPGTMQDRRDAPARGHALPADVSALDDTLAALPGDAQLADTDDTVFSFGPFRLIPAQRTLEEDGNPVRLGGRAFDLLLALVRQAGAVVSKEALIASVWRDLVVDESGLRVQMAALRKALGEQRTGMRHIATVPQRESTLWPGGELIWEASETYNYARTTRDGRIIIGGGDDETVDPQARDSKMPEKSEKLVDDLVKLWPSANPVIDFSWSGAFGETDDGLPLIGAVPGMPRILAAYGYGGNGITFSFMASRILAQLCAGQREGWFEAFAIDRPAPGQ